MLALCYVCHCIIFVLCYSLQDLVVSAPLYNDEEGQSVGGCIFVYMNSAGVRLI